MKEDLIKQINEIDIKIDELQSLRNRLASELVKSAATIKEKLQIWVNDTNRKHERWILDQKFFPKLRDYYDEFYDMNRYETYKIEDAFEDEIYDILHDEPVEISKNVIECLEEAINANLGSFKCDW